MSALFVTETSTIVGRKALKETATAIRGIGKENQNYYRDDVKNELYRGNGK